MMLGDAPAIINLRATLYLPKAGQKRVPFGHDLGAYMRCVRNETAAEMARLFAESDWQQREHPVCDARLSAAAQEHAEEMLRLRYFGHASPAGLWPNRRVRSFGYELPPWFADDANNVESIILNIVPASAMFDAWRTSETHWRHIAGLHPFFAEQRCYGMGYVEGPDDAGKYGVLISAPPEQN